MLASQGSKDSVVDLSAPLSFKLFFSFWRSFSWSFCSWEQQILPPLLSYPIPFSILFLFIYLFMMFSKDRGEFLLLVFVPFLSRQWIHCLFDWGFMRGITCPSLFFKLGSNELIFIGEVLGLGVLHLMSELLSVLLPKELSLINSISRSENRWLWVVFGDVGEFEDLKLSEGAVFEF